MRTPPLRIRVTVVSLGVLALAFGGFGFAVTLAYRDSLRHDLRSRLASGAAALTAASPAQRKALIGTLALEGVAVRFAAAPTPSKAGATAVPPLQKPPAVQTKGSLLVLSELLVRDHPVLDLTLSANAATVSASVDRLITVELIAGAVTLAVAALLLLRGLSAALAPLGRVGHVAGQIAAGDWQVRLRPTNPDSELGRMAGSLDAMVDALELAAEQAQASETAMRRFVADASHELRTPIAALQATTETLLREQPPRPERDTLEARLAREVARLGRLANDLLNLARLQASEPIERAPLNLAELTRATAEEARRAAPDATVTVKCRGDTRVVADAEALSRALRNLLENALTATNRAGHIDIDLKREGSTVVACVRDDGPGVAPNDRERIFESFVSIGHNTTGGAGLGLAIARHITRAHDGELSCDDCTTGACFTIAIPAAPQSQPDTPIAVA